MNRRTFFKAMVGGAALVAMPTTAAASEVKTDWKEYVASSRDYKREIDRAWIAVETFDSDEAASKAFKKLVTIEPDTTVPMEFAGEEFLVTSEEYVDRNRWGDESAGFYGDYENFTLAFFFIRQGSMIVKSGFVVLTSNGYEQAESVLEVTLEHERLPSPLTFLDATGNRWFVNTQGES